MKFFSGFSLKNESHFFDDLLEESLYSVAGFSYGAIKAFNCVQRQLENGHRVDTLQLFSPTFFQSKDDKFKRLQKMAYKKNQNKYLENFKRECFSPYKKSYTQDISTKLEDLEELLSYEWNLNELKLLLNKGVNIEVYLGGKDKIIDVKFAKEFFLEVSTLTYIKNANHFLQIE